MRAQVQAETTGPEAAMAEQATVWQMHAHDRHGTFYDLGPRPWVELHGLNYPIVEVAGRLVGDDDPAATHWGWLKTDADEPRMIWPNWPCYSVCFPYGPAAEEEAGKGRTVRLAVTATGNEG